MAIDVARLRRALFAPVDPASLVVFRVGFGLLMAIATLRFVAHGWVDEHFVAPTYFFKYYGFEWVKPWPRPWMYAHYAAMGLAALALAAGFRARLAALTFGVLFTYAHLIDKTHYLNHYYLVSLLSFLMAAMPLGEAGSSDARGGRGRRTFPAWVLWTLRFQIGVVYFFGGVAKLSYDWLVHAQPMTIWLAANTDFPVLGRLFHAKWTAYAMSWLGAAFDLSVPFLLLWRRSRPFAYAAVIAFHVITAQLFQLGMFPWIMTFCATVFFAPEWPRRLLPRVLPPADPAPCDRGSGRWPALTLALLSAYAIVQLAMPLRDRLYPGRVTWTEQGFRFAWKVMLMEKDGVVDFVAEEPATGRRWVLSPERDLTRYQAKMMSTQPDMILEYSHHLAEELDREGARDVTVRADAYVSLNGRPPALLIDPSVDLARERDGLGPKRWILPLGAPEPQL